MKTKRTLTIATAPLVLMAMTLALAALIGTPSTATARSATSPPVASPSPDTSPGICSGRMIKTYYDSSSGDPLVFPPAFFFALFSERGAIMKGFLYLPGHTTVADSQKNLPLIIFDHGSEQGANDYCAMASYFTDKGFAFFIPHRRGQGLSTGMYYLDFLDFFCQRTAQNPFGTCGKVGNNAVLLAYLRDQTFEVAQAISYMSSLKNSAGDSIINPDKVAIMGHSFGGMVALFNNTLLTNHKAVVDIAGASESWDFFDGEDGDNTPDNSNSIRILKAAVRQANKPIFFLEPKNDVSIRPTVVLSKVAGDHEERYQAVIYAPVPGARTGEEAHGGFVLDHDQVHKWGPTVIDFLSRFGVK